MAKQIKRHRDKTKKKRLAISFLLYVFIAMFSVCCCNIAVVANYKRVADIFTSYDYVQALQDDVTSYAKDRCKEASVPDSFVDSTITYDQINHLQESYIYNRMSVGKNYNDQAFDSFLDDFNTELNANMRQMIDEQGIASDSKSSIDSFCNDITQYIRNKIEFKYITQLKSVAQKVKILAYAFGVISVIAIVVLSIILFVDGAKNYRITRNYAYSFLSASILDFLLVFSGLLVKSTKQLVVYPMYLARSVMNYYNHSLLSFTYAGILLFLIFLVFACLTWKYKRQEKE